MQINIKHLAFTSRFNGRVREIITDVKVKVNDLFTDLDHTPKDAKAIWDTGATNSVITPNLIKLLKIPPTGRVTAYSVHGAQEVNTYLIDIILPNKVLFQQVEVSEGRIGAGNVDLLIGMDIITHGDFALTNANGKTTLSFRIPSFREIDFVPDTNKFNLKMTPGISRKIR